MKIIKLIIDIDNYLLLEKPNYDKKALYEFPFLTSCSDNIEEDIINYLNKKEASLANLKKISFFNYEDKEVLVYEVKLKAYKLKDTDKLLYSDELFTLEYSDLDYKVIEYV